MTAAPIRVKSLKGEPKPNTSIERTCIGCGASFLGSFSKKMPTRERGIWRQWHWFCSYECAGEEASVPTTNPGSEA